MQEDEQQQQQQEEEEEQDGANVCVCGPSEKTLNFYPLILFELLFSGLLMGFAF